MTDSSHSTGVLFVCTGNICRSPTAEGMLRKKLADMGRAGEFNIDSAGIHALVGRSPEALAVDVATEYGVDLSSLTARQYEPEDFSRFEHIIAMDLGHLDFLNATRPDNCGADIAMLLSDTGNLKNVEVPDPYGRDRDDYVFSAKLIATGIDYLVERLLN